MSSIFANLGNLILTALFFHPLLPLSIPITFLGLILSYWINKYILLWRVRRPEEMSGLMANFFANLLPYIAFLWALSLALFYRKIMLDRFNGGEIKVVPMWAMLGYSGLFIILPVRHWINKCIKKKL
jgi:hypothetical protein